MSNCEFDEYPAKALGLCVGHYTQFRRKGIRGGLLPRRDGDQLSRYLSYVDQRGDDECWPWTGGRHNKNYGMYADGKGGNVSAHRFGFEALVRSLDPGEVVDHTCHNEDESCAGGDSCEHRACQNPSHWEAVDDETNGKRGKSFSAVNSRVTECPAGHKYTPDNIYWVGKPGKLRRQCKICTKAKARAREATPEYKEDRRNRYAEARAAGMSPADARVAASRRR